jgi:hypothetical protein
MDGEAKDLLKPRFHQRDGIVPRDFPDLSQCEGTGNTATVDVRKFSEYIFKDGAAPGKDVVFKNLGYSSFFLSAQKA